jgi:hypothetical protein
MLQSVIKTTMPVMGVLGNRMNERFGLVGHCGDRPADEQPEKAVLAVSDPHIEPVIERHHDVTDTLSRHIVRGVDNLLEHPADHPVPAETGFSADPSPPS